MVNSVGLLGMTLSDANKAIKKLPYGPIRVVYCSKLVSNHNVGVYVSLRDVVRISNLISFKYLLDLLPVLAHPSPLLTTTKLSAGKSYRDSNSCAQTVD